MVLTDYYKIDPETELIVVYDDISLAPGQIRVRKKGRRRAWIKSIISQLERRILIRVRVGFGEKPPKWDLADLNRAVSEGGTSGSRRRDPREVARRSV